MKDFSKTNYSSARAALLEAWRYFLGRRAWLVRYWINPIYELWMEEAVNNGAIDAPDYYGNRYAYLRARWIFAGRGWVDPVKEAEAAGTRMNYGLSTLEAECAEQGLDYEEVMEQRAYERKKMTEMGLDTEMIADRSMTQQANPSTYPSDDPTQNDNNQAATTQGTEDA